MGLMDDLKKNAGDAMKDPQKREKIQKMAAEKGISVDKAKERLLKKKQE